MTRSTTLERDTELEAKLLTRIESLRELIEANIQTSEDLKQLAPDVAAAAKAAGLFQMKVPRDVGGEGASPVVQMRVLARLAELDVAIAWNTMIINNGTAFMAAFLPDEGFNEVFADGIPVCAGVAPPYGEGVKVQGGYRVTGRFRLCSGVHQASWIRLTTFVTEGDKKSTRFIIVPQQDLTIHDNWNVLGVRGSGSPDVELTDYFVPDHRTFATEVQYRGGAQQRLRGLTASAYEHVAIAIGLGRRAISEAYAVAASRPAVYEAQLTELGRLSVAFDAAIALAEERFTSDYAKLDEPDVNPATIGQGNSALAAHVTDVAVEVIEFAFRFAGSAALYTPNVFERLLRDIHGATQHIAVQQVHYTNLATRKVDELRDAMR